MDGPGEFQIIQDYFARAKKSETVLLGIGDDCALLQPPPGAILATSVDTLVEGVHFPETAPPALLAARALRVNLSDLAAMNAEPLWFTLALTLPGNDQQWLAEFARGLHETAQQFDISLVGGDTTRGPLSITIQVTGHTRRPLRRDGAKAGDAIFVSGPLGAAAAALPVVLGQRQVQEAIRLRAEEAFYLPEPQFPLAADIADCATSAIDISDGLLADLGHICRASNVDAEIDLGLLPGAKLAQELNPQQSLQLAASGGDDYQLCFTAPAEKAGQLEKRSPDVVRIGSVTEGSGKVQARLNGKPWQPGSAGYQHF